MQWSNQKKIEIDRDPSPTGDLWQGIRVRRRRRRWTTAALVRRDRRKKKRGGATALVVTVALQHSVVTVARGEELRGLGLTLEASNQIDCQLIQSFPVREYISLITKISKKK
jgi:hypothetical protein